LFFSIPQKFSPYRKQWSGFRFYTHTQTPP
jgi:hypothetical protein